VALAVLLHPGLGAGTVPAAGAQSVPPAPERTSTNLQVATASYLGALGTHATAVDVAPDGTTVLGGVVIREAGDAGELAAPGAPPAVNVQGGGNGVVLRLVAGVGGSAPAIHSVTRLPGAVEDLKVNASGQIAACGDFGVVVLDALATAPLWAERPGPVRRCAFGDDGTLVALASSAVFVYQAGGGQPATWFPGGTAQSDVALDPTRGLVFVTGHTNRRTTKGEPVQVAYLKAWSTAGAPAWTAYDAAPDRLGAAEPDTRGVRLTLGRDGKLYFAAESAGGNSLFGRQPRDPAQLLLPEQLVQTDVFTNPTFNTPRNHITWFGRYNPADGSLEQGQFVLARLDDARLRGNSIRPRAIAADEEGRVYLVGAASASIEDRDVRTISGTAVGPYGGGEAFLLVLQPDLRQRVVWTTFTAPAGAGTDPTHDSVAIGVGVRNGVAALAATVSRGGLLTFNSLPGATPPVPLNPPATPPASSGGPSQATSTASATVTAVATATAATTASAAATATATAAATATGSPRATAAAAATSTLGALATFTGLPLPSLTPASVSQATPALDPAATRAYVAIWFRSGEAAERSLPAAPAGPAPIPGVSASAS
jgi:hypothetical protein